MKKLHGVYSIQPLTLKDISVANDAAIQEHKLLLDHSTSSLDVRITTLETLLGGLTDLDELSEKVDLLVGVFERSPSFSMAPEYPSSTITSLGNMEISGSMHVDFDLINEKTYFEWSSSEVIPQSYGVVIDHKFPFTPPGYKIQWNSLHFTSRIIGSGSVNLSIKHQGSEVVNLTLMDNSEQWVRTPFPASDIAALNSITNWDKVVLKIQMSAYNGGIVHVSTFEGDLRFVTV